MKKRIGEKRFIKSLKRYFVAVEFSCDVSREAIRLQNELKKKNFFVGSYTAEDKFHLTLHFFGNLNREDIVLVRRRLREIEMKKFEVTLGGLDVFNIKDPKVLFISVRGKGLRELNRLVLEKLRVGESRKFKPHLILVRIMQLFDKRRFLEELEKINVSKKRFLVERISLIESGLSREGRVYKVIEDFELR